MKTFGATLLVLCIASWVSVSAQAKCSPFATDRVCQASTPRLNVDFGKGLQKNPASEWVPLKPRQADAKPLAVPIAPQPIDCQMVRHIEQRADPMTVKAPPPGVNYAARIVEMPKCPRK